MPEYPEKSNVERYAGKPLFEELFRELGVRKFLGLEIDERNIKVVLDADWWATDKVLEVIAGHVRDIEEATGNYMDIEIERE